MAADTSEIRRKTRRAKDLVLDKAIKILENPEKYPDLYNETYQTVLKNSIPRSQEITGEEGEAIKTVITGINYITPHGNNTQSNPETAPSL